MYRKTSSFQISTNQLCIQIISIHYVTLHPGQKFEAGMRLAFFFFCVPLLFEERERLIEEAERALRQKRKQVMLDSRLNEYQATLLMSARGSRSQPVACWKSREHSFIFSSYTNTLLSLDAFVVYYIRNFPVGKNLEWCIEPPGSSKHFKPDREGFDLISCWHGLFSINFPEGWYELLGRLAKAAKAQKKLDRAQQKARLLVGCQVVSGHAPNIELVLPVPTAL